MADAEMIIGGVQRDLKVSQGRSFTKKFVYVDDDEVPISLTGYTGVAEVRSSVDSDSGPPLFAFTVTVNQAVAGAAGCGEVMLTATPAQTALLTGLHAVYDVYLVSGTAKIDFISASKVLTQKLVSL